MSDEYMTGYHAGYAAGMQNSWPEEARARIEELEAALAAMGRERDAAWNEAIEAAAEVAATKFKWPVSNLQVANAVRELKRP